jgi:hypothetical protein
MRFGVLIASVVAACHEPPAVTPDAVVHVTITAHVNSTRFETREHMLASGEMQISGEPLAEAMGRDLGGYSRDRLPTDLYFEPRLNASWIDLVGFSTGVESYEYSKQPMNALAFETGAGTSLVYGPLVDFDNATGAAAKAHLVALVQHYALGSHTLGRFVFPAGTWPVNNASGNVNPTGTGLPAANPIGWPGIWPTLHVFASFDPALDPTGDVGLACALTSDDNPAEGGGGAPVVCGDYECDASSLHLRDRTAQIDATITPGADGFSGWKYGLWVINYLQVMHDSTEAPVASVDGADLGGVGTLDNQIVGDDGSGTATAAGTYLGSSDVEGFQAQLFISQLDNRAADWLLHLSTADGATLSGFATINAALAYDYTAPLRWFPAEIGVTETDDGSGFPHPHYALASPNSRLLDLVGLVLGFSEAFALTDTANVDVGGAQSSRAYFDGDPFAADNQLADGQATLHDRALAMLRVAIVDLDRLHGDASGVFVDEVTMAGATPTRGHTLSTTSAAYTVLGLRTALRSLGSQLQLYSNNTPDTALTATPLDALAIHYPGDPALSFSGRLEQLIRAHADLLFDHLTDAAGHAFVGWDVAAAATISDDDLLDSHTAAIRGLFAAYLATGDVRYRDRAIVVFDRMQAVFYDPDARIYGSSPAPVASVEYTPLRFALLQSALRDVYELVATRPGNEALAFLVEDRLGRLDKLVLDGWDDRDQNRLVAWPDECVNVQDGLPRGGLQMAERTLTGEIGSLLEQPQPSELRTPTSDREHDCVPEIDDAHLPATLAASITFEVTR